MLEKYNLKMPHAVYGGVDSIENVTAIIGALHAKKWQCLPIKGCAGLGSSTLQRAL